MNTRKLRKAILTLCSALLLVSLSVGATLAYLTASTDVVENTFTVGDVQIDLDEANVNEYGEKITVDDPETDVNETARVKENEYKLLPGHKYVKDPVVYVKEGSEECYVFVKIVNELEDIEAATTIADQMNANGWLVLDAANGVYYYKDVVDARKAEKTLKVFENFTIKGTESIDTLKVYKDKVITIDAYAIQKDTFGSAQEAWNAQTVTWEPVAGA